MNAAEELAFVYQALRSGLGNCVEWVDDRAALRVRNDPANQGLRPAGIKRLLIDYAKQGGIIEQRREERERWRSRREFWYRAIIPLAGFPHGLFVELELTDDDRDVPVVSLLNAHPATP